MAGQEERWTAVDDYIEGALIGSDEALAAALAANAAAGLPAIDVSPAQGKFLHLLARIIGARRILEVGTLGGYSAIWLARALGPGGKLVSLEFSPHHAAVARENLRRAGYAELAEVRVGAALETLPLLAAEGGDPFDLVFIDADKPNNPHYLDWALKLTRAGSVIVVDNVVRAGALVDGSDESAAGARALFAAMAAEPRLDATAVQTVGAKGWDGFAIMVVGR